MKTSKAFLQHVRNIIVCPTTFTLAATALLPVALLIAYIAAYAPATPIPDTADLNGKIIIAIADGTFNWQMLFEGFNGHRPLTARLLTIANYYLTNWNQHAELFVMLMIAVANACLLLALVVHDNPALLRWALLPTLFLLLSPLMGLTWLAAVYSTWHLNLLFVLLVLLLIVKLPHRWWALLLITGVSVLPMLTLTQGVLIWGIGVVAMYVMGHRKIMTFAVYGAVGALVMWLFVQGTVYELSTDLTQEATLNTVTLEDPLRLLNFTLTYLGAPIGMERPLAALVGGVVGCVLLAAQTLYLAQRGELRRVWVLLLLALYSVGTSLLVGVGRINLMGMEAALQERFLHSSILFWLAVVLVTIIATRLAYNARHWGVAMMARINTLLLVAFGGLFLVNTYFFAGMLFPTGDELPVNVLIDRDVCTANLLLRDMRPACVEYPHIPSRELAVMGVAGYTNPNVPPSVDDPLLTSGYAIIMTENPWTSYFIYRHTLPGAHHERSFLMLPDNAQDDYERIVALSDVPVPAAYTEDEASTLRTQVAGAPGVWLVHDESLDADDVFRLNSADYALVRRWRQRYDISVRHYIALQLGEQQVQFGDEMILIGWQTPAVLEVAPCSTLPLHTFWQAAVDEGERVESYGLSLVLAGADGVGVSAANGATSLDTTDWFAKYYYADARTIEIPCDAPTGEYPLLLSAYPLDEPGANLPVTVEDGTPMGDFLYLTTVLVVGGA